MPFRPYSVAYYGTHEELLQELRSRAAAWRSQAAASPADTGNEFVPRPSSQFLLGEAAGMESAIYILERWTEEG